ncbi:MAG: cation:proton antiporter [Muribaculaceae bacterium]
MSIESLITDLAFILLMGAIVTVVFKWLKQPVVLGYIVAGFLASPNFTYIPSVTTAENIDFWAEIGIVVLLFSLGLEFSFKKLMSSGGSAVVTALIIVTGMMGVGFVVGRLMHFNTINSLFLGGMLSMSSTTIILKAFTDMGLRQQKFASQVLAVLIVEDLFAVVMMVLLSSIALNNSVEGSEMLMSVAKLLFFLIIWTLVGVYVIPSGLNRIRRYLNAETLLVVSMGLCLGMAVFSVLCGFSLALGAFVMGSILAGTSYAERIEHVVSPVKDLFGAVFFISVGMMVQPAVIAHYWLPILILSAVVIVGMIVFGTFGMLVTGQTLRVAVRSGFSLTQIGEFAFIIATLGMNLGVLDATLYPIVVAVSVLTTFATPYFIKMSQPAADALERHLPKRLVSLISRYRAEADKEQADGRSWAIILKRYLWRTILYSIVLMGIIIISASYLQPWLMTLSARWSNLLGVSITLAAMSPFLLALIMPVSATATAEEIADVEVTHNIPRLVVQIFRSVIALAFIIFAVWQRYPARVTLWVAVVVAILLLLAFSRRIRRRMNAVETKFLDNLNERELRRNGRNNSVVSDLHLAYMTVSTACEFVGERLANSNLRRNFGVNVVTILRGAKHIPIPDGSTRIFPGDVIGVIGTDEQLQRLLPAVEVPDDDLAAPSSHDDVKLTSIILSEHSPLIGHTPISSSLRHNYETLVVAIDRGGVFIDSGPDLRFAPGDIVYLVGDPRKIQDLK